MSYACKLQQINAWLHWSSILLYSNNSVMDMPTEFSVVNDGGDSEHHRLARHLLNKCMAWCTHMFPKLIFCPSSSRDATSFMLADRCLIHRTHHFSTWDACLMVHGLFFLEKMVHCLYLRTPTKTKLTFWNYNIFTLCLGLVHADFYGFML